LKESPERLALIGTRRIRGVTLDATVEIYCVHA
jgi:hypothetical protein